MVLADWAGFEARRAEARRRGRYRGIGIANYIELNTGIPRERAEITVRPEGRSTSCSARCRPARDTRRASPSSSPSGSACELAQVRLVTGDTDLMPCRRRLALRPLACGSARW